MDAKRRDAMPFAQNFSREREERKKRERERQEEGRRERERARKRDAHVQKLNRICSSAC